MKFVHTEPSLSCAGAAFCATYAKFVGQVQGSVVQHESEDAGNKKYLTKLHKTFDK